jgi:hypothetical protein
MLGSHEDQREYIEGFNQTKEEGKESERLNGKKSEIENYTRAGIRNLFSRNLHMSRISTRASPKKLEDKPEVKQSIVINITKPRSDAVLEDELNQREDRIKKASQGMKTKRMQLAVENEEFVDPEGVNDDVHLWMRINQNA